MMNTRIYKAVHDLAENLMEAVNQEDNEAFAKLYAELNDICVDNDNTDKDHPVQWETLADFTEELEDALSIYAKALEKATAINSKDYMSSIAYSIATLKIEQGRTQEAIDSLKNAKISANKIEDQELKDEIAELLETLLAA